MEGKLYVRVKIELFRMVNGRKRIVNDRQLGAYDLLVEQGTAQLQLANTLADWVRLHGMKRD